MRAGAIEIGEPLVLSADCSLIEPEVGKTPQEGMLNDNDDLISWFNTYNSCHCLDNNFPFREKDIYNFKHIKKHAGRCWVNNSDSNTSDNIQPFYRLDVLERLILALNKPTNQDAKKNKDEVGIKILNKLNYITPLRYEHTFNHLINEYKKQSLFAQEKVLLLAQGSHYDQVAYFSSILLSFHKNAQDSFFSNQERHEMATIYKKYCKDLNKAYRRYDFEEIERVIRQRYHEELNYLKPSFFTIASQSLFFFLLPALDIIAISTGNISNLMRYVIVVSYGYGLICGLVTYAIIKFPKLKSYRELSQLSKINETKK